MPVAPELLEHAFGRRRLLALGVGAFGLGALAATFPGFPGIASAQPPYEAMLLMCIDPRFVRPINEYMKQRGLTDDYSQFALAGAAAGVVAPRFESWHDTFWENLAASIELHEIDAVIAIDHRDCSAVKIAYGSDSISTPERETATHEMILGALRDGVMQRHPDLSIEGWLMALDGSVLRII